MDIISEEIGGLKIEKMKRSHYVEMSYFHHHSCYELFIILSGERKMILQDKIYQGYAGDVFLIPPQYIHRSSGAEHTRILINFTEEYLLEYFSQSMVNRMLKCFDIFTIKLNSADLDSVIAFSEEICELKENGDTERLMISLAQLLFFLCDRMDYDVEIGLTSTSMQLVSSILSYINSNYRELNDVKKISDKFYISEEYLCRIFKKHTEVTVVSYINGLKLKAAEKMLLGKTKTSISEIAEECGFSTPAYFGKIFKKNYGVSPLSYRSMNMK